MLGLRLNPCGEVPHALGYQLTGVLTIGQYPAPTKMRSLLNPGLNDCRKDRTVTTQVTATVIGGLLKPDQSLPLADHTRVKLTIEPLSEGLEPMQAWQALKAWIQQNPLHGLGRRLTRDELHERR